MVNGDDFIANIYTIMGFIFVAVTLSCVAIRRWIKKRKKNDPNYLPTYMETIRETFSRSYDRPPPPSSRFEVTITEPPIATTTDTTSSSTSSASSTARLTTRTRGWWLSGNPRGHNRPPPSYQQNTINDIIEHRPAWWRPEMSQIAEAESITEGRARSPSAASSVAPSTAISAGAGSYASTNGFGSVSSESPLNPIRLEAKTLPIAGEEEAGGSASEPRSGLELPPSVEYKGVTRPMSAHVSWGRPPSYITDLGHQGPSQSPRTSQTAQSP